MGFRKPKFKRSSRAVSVLSWLLRPNSQLFRRPSGYLPGRHASAWPNVLRHDWRYDFDPALLAGSATIVGLRRTLTRSQTNVRPGIRSICSHANRNRHIGDAWCSAPLTRNMNGPTAISVRIQEAIFSTVPRRHCSSKHCRRKPHYRRQVASTYPPGASNQAGPKPASPGPNPRAAKTKPDHPRSRPFGDV
jgi:hypothetical protein